ncbi:hypothetical protein [Nocardioides sp. WS12]|uniref:hypothetical protein n=1 Tax=Nocardioides sp. WS12 TaxID=2486272 RepID=UPI0015FD872A|nr:hypothetical protein [Nocardioides sp. WS12]
MPDKSYQVVCTGLWVGEEQDWDQSTPSDEYYLVITTMVRDSKGVLAQKTVTVPGAGEFESMDTGDWKKFEVLCWDGPMNRFGTFTQLYESDEGQKKENRKLINDAATQVVQLGTGTIPEGLQKLSTDIFMKLLDLDDDMIDAQVTRVFNSAATEKLVNSPQKKSVPEGIPYRFRTDHWGGGGRVRMYYDIRPS